MLEVFPHGNGFAWRWVCHQGRTLWEDLTTHPSMGEAFAAARSYRVAFWARADLIDHRQGRCV